MKKLAALLVGVGFMLALLSGVASADDYDLIQGRDQNVLGSVTITHDASDIFVALSGLSAPFDEFANTNVHVSKGSLAGIPQRNGNPPPGRFDYVAEYTWQTTDTTSVTVDIPHTGVGTYYIAVHAKLVDDSAYDLVEETGEEYESVWGGYNDFL